jgi:hypothetical protein
MDSNVRPISVLRGADGRFYNYSITAGDYVGVGLSDREKELVTVLDSATQDLSGYAHVPGVGARIQSNSEHVFYWFEQS